MEDCISAGHPALSMPLSASPPFSALAARVT
jgi:hypothetical protein